MHFCPLDAMQVRNQNLHFRSFWSFEFVNEIVAYPGFVAVLRDEEDLGHPRGRKLL